LEIHCSGRASQEITKRIGWNQPAAGDKNGPKLAFTDKDVKRTARQTRDFGGVIDPICQDSFGRQRHGCPAMCNISLN
jgi:hypothetical protein